MVELPISIVVVCDNHYIVLLAALIKSIELNHVSSEKIDIYIVEDKITEANKFKLQQSIATSTVTLFWLKMSNCIPPTIKLPFDKSSYPLNIYVRLFIPYFLPQRITKVIYLDVDMIVQTDINSLWNTNLDEYVLAAVTDPKIKTVSNLWGGILNYQSLGLRADTKYFNSGVLVVDTRKFLSLDIAEKVIECITKYSQFANYPDQYGLNVVIANQWLELDSRWNHFTSETYINIEPFLFHFAGRKPIYQSYKSLELYYKDRFYYYLKLTEWRHFRPISESNRYMKKIVNIFSKISLLTQQAL